MALISRTSPSSYVRNEMEKFRSNYGLNLGVEVAKTRLSFLSFNSSACPAKTPLSFCTGSASVGCKRGSQLTVAASPPAEDVAVAAEPLTKEDLIGYHASGCKPKEKWRYCLLHSRHSSLIYS